MQAGISSATVPYSYEYEHLLRQMIYTVGDEGENNEYEYGAGSDSQSAQVHQRSAVMIW